jgi:hypothetical protein
LNSNEINDIIAKSEKSSNILIIENKTKENIILTKMPTELEKEIMDKATQILLNR